MPTVRRLRPALAAALTVFAVLPFVARAGAPTGDDLLACDAAGQVKAVTNGWVRINSPKYASGEGADVVSTYAVPPDLGLRAYVTNGQVVQATTTAGCKWDHIYPAPSSTPDAVTPPRRTVAQLVAPKMNELWIASYDALPAPQPHIERTTDATPITGSTTSRAFASADHGLPPVGKPIALSVSPNKDNRAFLLIEGVAAPTAMEGDAASRTLYRMVDGPVDKAGFDVQWEQATTPDGFGAIDGVRINPNNADCVWVWSGNRFAFSPDSGATWPNEFTAPGTVTALDVNGRGDALVAYAGSGRVGALEVTRGEDHNYSINRARTLPGQATAIVHGDASGVWATTGPGGTFGFDTRKGRWASLHPKHVAPFVSLAMGTSAKHRILMGQAAGALYRWDLYPGETFIAVKGVNTRYTDYGALPIGLTKPTLHARFDVTVRPDEVAKDPVDLGVNPDPTPLDVFFLMDTTTSMQSSIDGLKIGVQRIADEIAAKTHGQACFGVGEFKDESLVEHSQTSPSVTPAYRVVQPVLCEGSTLANLHTAVNTLHESGGNSDQREVATIALSQAVNGRGWASPPVLPGQDAKFRAGKTKRVIVLITDAGFMKEPQNGATFPSIDSTVQDLNGYRTNVVGIVVHDKNDASLATDDVTSVVAGTHTYAPEKGVDCDGDHKVDLQPGDPLVCHADGSQPRIGDAVIGLLLGVKDMGTIALNFHDPYHVVRKVDGALSAVRNLKLENHLVTQFHLTCAADQDGMDLPVRLTGIRRTSGIIDGTIVVHCRAPRIAPKIPPAPPEPEPDPLPLPRPPIAPVLVPQFQPPPVNNPPANMNPNAGFSQQEEQQLQLAAVTQDEQAPEEEPEGVELEMSAVSHDDAAAAGLVWGCALFVGAAAAAGYAHRLRTQRSTRTATVRY